HPSIAPYETYQARDQSIALAVGTDGQFARLCDELGAPELAGDPRFENNPARVENRVALRSLIEARLATRDAAEWIDAFTAVNIPAGRVNTIAQAIELAESLGLDPVAETTALDEQGT